MANSIVLKRNNTNGDIPLPNQLLLGEPVINSVSGRLFVKDTESVVVDVGSSIIDVIVTNNKFYFNGSLPGSLLLQKGQVYIFRQTDASNIGNTIYLSTAVIWDYPNNAYTVGVENQTEAVVWKVPYDVPEILYINSQQTDNYGIPIVFGTQFSHKLPFSKSDGSIDSVNLEIGSHELPFLKTDGTSDPVNLDAISVTPDLSYTRTEVDNLLTGKLSVTGGSVSVSIIPSNTTVDLGTVANPFRDLYLTEGTLHLGSTKISTEDKGDGTKKIKVDAEEIATVNHDHNELYYTSEEVDIKLAAIKKRSIAMSIVFG